MTNELTDSEYTRRELQWEIEYRRTHGMNTAAKVRAAKEKNPENFCRDPRCLWRTVTRDGIKPCPKHPAVGREVLRNAKGEYVGEIIRKTGTQMLIDAIRHIRRVHMNCRTWTLPIGDQQAVELMELLSR